MAEYVQRIEMNHRVPGLQIRELYRLGAISTMIVAGSILLSIIAYFIWPYKAGMISTESVFSLLQQDRLGGLISLDLPMLIIIPMNILPITVIYFSLKRVNEHYALLALILGLVGVALLIQTRPLVEIVYFSNQYNGSVNEAIRNRYLAAGDLLLAQFSGTAWHIQNVFLLVSGIMNAILMLHCSIFRRITAITELVVCIIGLGFFLPVIGVPLLFLNTIGSIFVYFLIAGDFIKAQKSAEMRNNDIHPE
jgi:hypothetical protein